MDSSILYDASRFIELNSMNVSYLFVLGFIGGLVSGFIGSGGAFVLTPGMMSLGVQGIVAVATNMCHKFPKALVGAIKRAKYKQVDLKLGIIFGFFAEAGVLYGASIQEKIKASFGNAGSNLYVSVIFILVLAIVGGLVVKDAIKSYKSNTQNDEKEIKSKIATWVQSINIPFTMFYFESIKTKVSIIFIIPMAFLTGLLAATIAVGGFIGVPSMIYILGVPTMMASATELVVAFVMGLGGSLKYAYSGLIDIRIVGIILAGSLFGVQLGAIGTTYVKPFMIKVVMGMIMIIVLFSRALVVPVYLSQLQIINPLNPSIIKILEKSSFIVMAFALLSGAFIILKGIKDGCDRDHISLLKKIFAQDLYYN